MPFHRAWTELNQRGMARARGNLACFASSRETGSAVVRSCDFQPKPAVDWRPHLARRTTVLNRRREGLLPSQRYSHVRSMTTTRAARHASAASSRAAPPSERQAPQWRACNCDAKAGRTLEAAASTSHHSLAPKETGHPVVQYPLVVRVATTTSAPWCARAASSRAAPPPERYAAQCRSLSCHAKAGCALEAAAGTSHRDLAAKREMLFAGVVSLLR